MKCHYLCESFAMGCISFSNGHVCDAKHLQGHVFSTSRAHDQTNEDIGVGLSPKRSFHVCWGGKHTRKLHHGWNMVEQQYEFWGSVALLLSYYSLRMSIDFLWFPILKLKNRPLAAAVTSQHAGLKAARLSNVRCNSWAEFLESLLTLLPSRDLEQVTFYSHNLWIHVYLL